MWRVTWSLLKGSRPEEKTYLGIVRGVGDTYLESWTACSGGYIVGDNWRVEDRQLQ
jgi:hypothetical protein